MWLHQLQALLSFSQSMFVQVCACIHQPVWPGTTRRSQIERGCVGRVPRVPNPRWPRSKKGTQAQHRALAPSTQHQARAPRARAPSTAAAAAAARFSTRTWSTKHSTSSTEQQHHSTQHRAPTQQQHRAGAAPSTQHQARARAPSAQQQQQQQRGSHGEPTQLPNGSRRERRILSPAKLLEPQRTQIVGPTPRW